MVSTEQRRHALLYVAGRFMTVHIDKCGRARATRHKQQAFKLGPGFKLKGGWARKAASSKLPDRGAWIKFRGASSVGLDQDKRVGWMLHMEGNLVR